MLEKVKQFVDESFGKKLEHFERTVFWLLKLKQDADEPMQIAAYAHDIERAFHPDIEPEKFYKNIELNDKNYLTEHQEKGAEIITNFLKENNYPEEEIKRVKEMVRSHEFGGIGEANLIKDADSISYFEVNALKHLEKFKSLGKDKIQRKFDFMYNRITSKEAKKFAEPFYNKVLELLK